VCTGDTGIEKAKDEDFVAIGYIARTHGVKGDVKVVPLSDIPDRYTSLKKVYIKKRSGEKREYSVVSAKEVKGGWIVSFVPSMTTAEAEEAVGGYIIVPASEVPRLEKDRYYHFEIIGMVVYTEDGRYLGRVVDIFSTGSNDVYVVKEEDREYLIPAIHDIIKEMDVKGRRMVIHPMEGLI